MLNQLNKIWLKRLNSYISKDEWLNWSKVSKMTNSKFHWNLRIKIIFNFIGEINVLFFLSFFHLFLCISVYLCFYDFCFINDTNFIIVVNDLFWFFYLVLMRKILTNINWKVSLSNENISSLTYIRKPSKELNQQIL